MPGRQFQAGIGYRYGFNGMEKDDEIKGSGNSLDFGARIYDTRLGRWLSLDPAAHEYASLSNYSAFGNSPLMIKDPDGKRLKVVNKAFRENFQNYINSVLGEDNGFSFRGKLLKVDKKYVQSILNDNSISQDKKDLVAGLAKVVNDKKVTINASIEESDFFFRKEKVISYYEFPLDEDEDGKQDVDAAGNPRFGKEPKEVREIGNKDGTKTRTSILFYNKSFDAKNAYLIINQRDANAEIEGVQGSEAATFFHEALDHGLDAIEKGTIDDSYKGEQSNKVKYENKARRELGVGERTGSDHE